MISKKELQSQIDSLFTCLSRDEKHIIDNMQDMDECKKAISKHATEIYDNETRIIDLHKRISQIEKGVTSLSGLKRVQEQVECSVAGHDFRILHIIIKDIDADRSSCINGRFKCINCGLEITRKLTKAEITAAKKLGLIK